MKSKAIELHEQLNGKIEIISKANLKDPEMLKLAYTPGVAEPCLEIAKDNSKSFTLTARSNLVAVVSDGSAVLGLGNIGALASMPVMEGKCALFKAYGDVDAFPIVLDTNDVDEIVDIVAKMQYTFGGINLEDISAPRCFEIEEKLKARLEIPVFHDDQHGTAVTVLAGLTNALKLADKKIEDVKIVVVGAGAAGTAITYLLESAGAQNFLHVDEFGILYPGRPETDWHKPILAEKFNSKGEQGSLADALVGADVLIGVSKGNIVSADMIRTMNKNAIVFAMANPTPEIDPALAKENGVLVMGTGRSDYDNQMNNVLVFPGLFRGTLDCGAKEITTEMKLQASHALASLVSDTELSPNYIIPKPFDPRVKDAVANAVAKAYKG